MQGLPSKRSQGGLRFEAELVRLGLEMRAIDGIAHKRVPDMGEVDTDLVGAPSLELAGQQRCDRLAVAPGKALQDFPMRHRLAATLAHRHLVPRIWVAVDRRIDRAAMAARQTPRKGQ